MKVTFEIPWRNFKNVFSLNPAVLFSLFHPAIWRAFYILLPFIALLLVKGSNPNRTTTRTTTTTTSTTTPTTTAPQAKGMYKLMIFEILLLWKKNLNVLYIWSKA